MFGTGADGKPLSKEEWKTRLARVVPNPFLRTIALDDSLKLALTADQKTKLKALSDDIAIKADKIAEELADVLTSAGNAPGPGGDRRAHAGQDRRSAKGRREVGRGSSGTLTPEQWAKLPENVKTVPAARGFGGFGGGGCGGGGGGGGGGGRGRPPAI